MAGSSGFQKGLRDGFPICLGYFSVSIAFGIMTAQSNVPFTVGTLFSLTNLTSAGQFAGLGIMVAGGTYLELALTTLIINARYFLMSMSLSQKVKEGTPMPVRMAMAFGVTDEIFAVAAEQKEAITGAYMAGLIVTPVLGWTLGTLTGATASTLLPQMVRSALGIMLYGMFVAIVVPPAKQARPVLYTVLAGMALSAIIYYVPVFRFISGGWSIIICTVLVAGFMAWRFPVQVHKEAEVRP